MTSLRKSFQAILEKIGTAPSRVVARVPFDPDEVWPKASRIPAGAARPPRDLRVKGSIRPAGSNKSAEFPFANSFLGKRHGQALLVVTQTMQKGAHIATGSLVQVEIEPDIERPPVPVPAELAKLLKQDRSVLKWYSQVAWSIQRYVAQVIQEPKTAETRQRRAEDWAERLVNIMEGEQEPPPVLKVEFRKHPQAQEGWEALTPNQRRIHLMTIFGSKSPEARAVRVEAALASALHAARRKSRKNDGPAADPRPARQRSNRLDESNRPDL
jgi:uncharacterized protein YdeI (YjbR/CyaY-like superfamily)